MADMFGVELPENIGSSESNPPETNQGTTEEKVSGTTTTPETTVDKPIDLDSVQKFRFDGREWTPKELKTAYMFQSDYSKKTTEVAEMRKFAENFDADLDKVLKDPALLSQLREVYPKIYVDAAEKILGRMNAENRPNGSNPTSPQKPSNDPSADRFSKIESELNAWRKAQREAEEEKIGSWLDNQFSTLSTKYPLVNPTLQEVVSARAEVLANKGTEITEKVLDKLFKQVNDDIKGHMDKTYKAKADEQIKAGSRSRDIGTGGGVPGQAPKTAKTIKEATDRWLSDLGQ